MSDDAEPGWQRAISKAERRRPIAPRERMERVITHAQAVVTGSARIGSVTLEVRSLANACLTMHAALERIRENDRTGEYEPGDSRPDGMVAPNETGEPGVWQTPRQIVDWVLGLLEQEGPLEQKGNSDGEETDEG